MIYIYVYNIFIYCFCSELKHLINYRNRSILDTVSSGERMRYKAKVVHNNVLA